jgi:hypothetical protein
MRRIPALVAGIATVVAVTWLWHSPLGAGDRFAKAVEVRARAQLDFDEMTRVQAHIERDPLTRHLILSGPADDFQRAEIKRRMELIGGVGTASWDPGSLDTEARR